LKNDRRARKENTGDGEGLPKDQKGGKKGGLQERQREENLREGKIGAKTKGGGFGWKTRTGLGVEFGWVVCVNRGRTRKTNRKKSSKPETKKGWLERQGKAES